jgi:hypothetical protein
MSDAKSRENAQVGLLRHTVATLAYRAAKVLRGAPAGFGHFQAAPTTRTAGQILAHMVDLLEWAKTAADGKPVWRESEPGEWENDVARFFEALKNFDDRLAAETPPATSPEKIFQGPIADALTHVGQLATLRRMIGSGIRGENYFLAEITIGRVGSDQAPPVREFD